MIEFERFFRQATANDRFPEGMAPYPYQQRLATDAGFPRLIKVPTGGGKTGAAILAWLYRRHQHADKAIRDSTARRLVYCLPMRVLVEQSQRECERWLKNLDLNEAIGLHQLMGGVSADEWYLHPEKAAILIGTQDMLLSRALNRGYAASRFHWPIDFGLLNNDCVWVFDEPQLMGSGVSTSSQLAGLRKALGSFSERSSVWMSATLEPGWLDTIDYRGQFPGNPLELDDADYAPDRPLYRKMTAEKTLHALSIVSSREMKDAARAVLEKQVVGTQTLVVLNTVERAKAMYDALAKLRTKAALAKLLLVHSRFRPAEREQLNRELQEKGAAAADRIIVATQVVEAGVDISARTLITELAPWASIVQRVGRCNRTGGEQNDGPGLVYWIDVSSDDKAARPYSADDLTFAREQLQKLEGQDVSPRALDAFKKEQKITLPFEHKHVLRRRDLLDLFDTSPDLSGNDIDIQRFVRGDDPETDVQVFWRKISADGPSDEEPRPYRQELCSVPIGAARGFLASLSKKNREAAFAWDHLEEKWMKIDPQRVRPGMVILLRTSSGGYSELGWDPASSSDVETVVLAEGMPEQMREEAAGSDIRSELPVPYSIAEHTQHVCDELAALLKEVRHVTDFSQELTQAARWHDTGKALLVCQQAMHDSEKPDPTRLLAKSGRTGKLDYGKYGRKHFRHELGSALAVLQQCKGWPFLIAYLIAAHHGRVRLSIRALPGENPPDDPSLCFALGVRDRDVLPEVDLGNGEKCPATTLDLTPMQLGGESSWTARCSSCSRSWDRSSWPTWKPCFESRTFARARKRPSDEHNPAEGLYARTADELLEGPRNFPLSRRAG